MTKNIVEFKDVSFWYKDNPIFENANIEIESGKFIAILGPNGVGKSTFMKLLSGELSPKKGKINLNFQNKIGYIPQLGAAISNEFPITVKEIMCLEQALKLKKFKRIDSETLKNIENILKELNLEDKIDSVFSDLSGGQKQKVMIGKSLFSNPDLLVMDEPNIGLDEESEIKLFEILKNFQNKRNVTIIMVTHDLKAALEFADEIYTIKDRRIIKTNA